MPKKETLSISIDRKLNQELNEEWTKKIAENPSRRNKLSYSQFLENLLRKGKDVPETYIEVPENLYEELRERWKRFNNNRLEEDISFEEFLRKKLL